MPGVINSASFNINGWQRHSLNPAMQSNEKTWISFFIYSWLPAFARPRAQYVAARRSAGSSRGVNGCATVQRPVLCIVQSVRPGPRKGLRRFKPSVQSLGWTDPAGSRPRTGQTVVDSGRLPRRHKISTYRSGDLSAAGMQWCRPSVALLARGCGMIVVEILTTVRPELGRDCQIPVWTGPFRTLAAAHMRDAVRMPYTEAL